MKTKTEMIHALQDQMQTLIDDNLKLVKQMSGLVKKNAELEARVEELEKKKR
jgi:cell division protein FtsB